MKEDFRKLLGGILMNISNSKPIRVLQVFNGLARGGAETIIMNLYRNIDRDKVQFDFIVHTKDRYVYDDEVEALGGRIFRFSKIDDIGIRGYIEQWNNFWKQHKEYHIIHGHLRSIAIFYLLTAKKNGVYTIIHSHNNSSGKGIKAIIKNMLQFPLRYIADYYFACSKQAGYWLFGKRIVNGNNFAVLNNAVDVDKFTFSDDMRNLIRHQMKISEGVKAFVHVGNFRKQKNHVLLIEIFARLHAKMPQSRLFLAGSGELENTIHELVQKKGLEEKVIFLGECKNIDELLQAMDYFLFPSLYEGLPVSVIEAQASGLPIFCSDTITRDVAITDLVHFLPLDNLDAWEKVVLKA